MEKIVYRKKLRMINRSEIPNKNILVHAPDEVAEGGYYILFLIR